MYRIADSADGDADGYIEVEQVDTLMKAAGEKVNRFTTAADDDDTTATTAASTTTGTTTTTVTTTTVVTERR